MYMSLEENPLAENEFILAPVSEEMELALNIMMYNGALRLYEHLQEIPGISKKTLEEIDKYIGETYG